MNRSRCGGGFLLLAWSALFALPAGILGADEKVDPPAVAAPPVVVSNCDLAGHKSQTQTFSPAADIPDNSPAGVTFGPIVLPADQLVIDHLVLELDCAHTWLGDLIVRLRYDQDSDGAVDDSSTVICRPGRTGSCGPSGAGLGCGANLTTGAVYRFDDTATSPLPESCVSGTNIPGGCYLPTGLGAGPLAVFRGLAKGGRWWLFVSDNGVSDRGTVTGWSVYLLNTTPVTPTSWGQLKLHYR